ncbi:MAG: glycoside hydrolase family 2 TIM barrel-domain containing protein, partial [Clostridia bacterium]|nr:glycoside hydrolase family 2 TIM barrel-domain containing protein [Clostridia bacterium]
MDWVEIRAYGVSEGTIELLGEEHQLIQDDASSYECASIHLDIRWPHLWSPEDPYLYDFTIRSGNDEVKSYFALRTLGIADVDGHKKLCLNGEPYFFNGLLDQGYWHDGIYTPHSYKCYEEDILAMKKLGFNTLRKHIKIEPERFYYDCDRLGMIVFQDMVNNGDYSFIKDSALPTIGLKKFTDVDMSSNPESRGMFLGHMEETVKHLYNHPSICYWTIFNEGWGQFCADSCYDKLRELDQTRFIDSTSGWFKQNKSDVDSYHVYFKPVDIAAGARPMVLSEFGGYSCQIDEHSFNNGKPYGYKKCQSPAELLSGMVDLYENQVLPLIEKGLSAAIYTQLSDIEDEVNGLVTYDRAYNKIETYIGTGRVELIGNHTDHQGGRVLVCPTKEKISAYVADNNEKRIRIHSEGFEPFEVTIGQGTIEYEKGTSKAIVAGLLAGFTERYGEISSEVNGFDCYIKSDIIVGGGSSSSAAFEILIARMINDKLYNGAADAVELAKIGMFSERAFYGKPCGMQDQLAISLGKPALLDFSGKEPTYELIGKDIDSFGYRMDIVPTESDHASANAEFSKIPEDMTKVANVLGLERLGDISRDKVLWRLPDLQKKVEEGEITELQLNRARHFYDETERALAGAAALETGNFARFLACVNESSLSSENLLKNILLEGETENNLSRT